MIHFTVLLFIVYTWGLGFAVSFFDNNKDFYEKNILRIGYGLAVIGFLVSLFSLLHIPIDWRIFLVLSLIGPSLNFIIRRTPLKIPLPNVHVLLALIVFSICLYFYISGAFAYPYLEDDDPWSHAVSASYICTEKTAYQPDTQHDYFSYLDARPPTFDGIMGILMQIAERKSEVLKIFTSLIICFGLLYFYFFARQWSKSSNKALFAMIILAMIPSYFTHFIWAHALVVTLFFPSLYCLNKIEQKPLWIVPASFCIAGIFLTQETQSIKFVVLLAGFFIIKYIVNRKANFKQIGALGLAVLISLIWWAPAIVRFGGVSRMYDLGIMRRYETQTEPEEEYYHPSIKKVYFGILGTATRQRGLYTWKDFFAAESNMINVSTGIGVAAMSLAILGTISVMLRLRSNPTQTEKEYYLFILFWFAFTFLGIHGGVRWWSPFALFSFRFWIIFSIPVALLCSETLPLFEKALEILHRFFEPQQILKFEIIVLLLVAVFLSSGRHKIDLNTRQWSPGGSWFSLDELQGFLWLKKLPPDTRVFSIDHQDKIHGMDMFIRNWGKEEMAIKNTFFEHSPEEICSWMKQHKYEYLVISAQTSKRLGLQINKLTKNILASDLFKVVHKTPNFVALMPNYN